MKKITFCKSLLLLLLLFSQLIVNAQSVNTDWATKVNQTFAGIDKNRIPHSLLKDYAMEFTDLTAYNGMLTDTTYIDANVLGDIYKTLFLSKVVADTVHTPLFDRYAYNWAKARYNATKDVRTVQAVYVLSGLLYE